MHLRRAIQILAQQFMYHITTAENAEKILQEGLKINSPERTLTVSTFKDWAQEIYGAWPIFLSADNYGWVEDDPDLPAVLRVDTSGLPLVADIPSLMDTGAQLDVDYVWWEEGFEFDQLRDVIDDGVLYYKDLLDPNSPVAKAAIELTQTAAVLEDIPPERIVDVI